MFRKYLIALLALSILAVQSAQTAIAEPSAAESTVSAKSAESSKLLKTRALMSGKTASASTSGESPGEGSQEGQSHIWVRMLQGLAMCLGLFLISVWAYKKYALKGKVQVPAGRMRVVDRIAINSKASLALVKVDGRDFVIAIGSEHLSIAPLDNQILPLHPADLTGLIGPVEAPDAESDLKVAI